MRLFRYEAADRQFGEHRGEIEAEGLKEAASALRDSGLFPYTIATDATPARGGSVNEAFAAFNGALAGLIRLRVPLSSSLRTLARSVGTPAFRGAVSDVADEVERGTSLDRALEKRGTFFPPLYLNLVRAGLASGNLAGSLAAVAQDVRERLELRRMLWRELAYPVVVLALAAAVVGILSATALSSFLDATSALEVELPYLTPVTIYGRIVGAGILAFAMLLGITWRTALGERIRLRLPLAGRLLRSLALTRFYLCLDTLLTSGRFDPSFMTAAAAASGSAVLEHDVARAVTAGWEGEPASGIVRAIPFFGKGDADLLALGERSGTFPRTVRDLAELHRDRLEAALALFAGVLPVAITVLLGAALGTLYASMVYPYVQLATRVTI